MFRRPSPQTPLVIAKGLRELLTSRELCDVALVAAGGSEHRKHKTDQAERVLVHKQM